MSAEFQRERIMKEFPLHWLVWQNDFKELEVELLKGEHNIELRDPRGRTPLMLAVALGHLESTRVLLRHNANVNVDYKDGFTVIHEAVSTGDPELLQAVLEQRDFQRYSSRIGGIPELLKKIRDTPDFYVEMKWEFTSWVPLVSRMCPSDTYKVYKSGSSVRIDTTLLGFDQTSWQRGSRSYIFKGNSNSAVMMEVDHELSQVYMENMRVLPVQLADMTGIIRPSPEAISARLTTPIVTTYVDTEKINFERCKSGLWGWRTDKTELVNGYNCKVFGANNVELITRTRTEHLTEADKIHQHSARSPLHSFLGIVEMEERELTSFLNGDTRERWGNPCHITAEEYFDSSVDLCNKDIGRPREVSSKIQKFKANLWLAENYPLSLPEQILPIIDLMAISSTHFAKLRDFITLQLPSGFPVKIEIPLFHVLNARITFGNIFGLDESVPGVTPIVDDNIRACVVDESCFDAPAAYTRIGSDEVRQLSIDEDDELLQLAIQHSLIEAGSEEDQVTIWEALTSQRPSSGNSPGDDSAFQRALQESMNDCWNNSSPFVGVAEEATLAGEDKDPQLTLALRLSQQAADDERRKLEEEEVELERVLKLSLTEK
ncbi:ankyrin repeat domain-containing protein 13D-like isoform X4 [Tachypleus tridentatus]|uniref:ankyrin repeat domain-containing protein 13D-like isoform X4 n=2 Tax=Tachypleus tridentatus TaxID=6853 RepID=UPI003FD36726